MGEAQGSLNGAESRAASATGMRPAAVVVALAALAAAASHGSPGWAPARGATPDRIALLLDVTVLGVLGIVAVVALAALLHRAQHRHAAASRPFGGTLRRSLAPATAVVAILGLLAISERSGGEQGRGGSGGMGLPLDGGLIGRLLAFIDDRVTGYVAGPDRTPAPEIGGTGAGEEGWGLLAILIAAALSAAAFALLASRRVRRSGPELHVEIPGPTPPRFSGPAVSRALGESIDAMLADPDPRRAIIGAYARLLEGLESFGVGRRPHEGPEEHMGRVSSALEVRPEPLRRLIRLFETARFSPHPLIAAHREEALAALRSIAAELQSIPAAGGGAGRPPASVRATGAAPSPGAGGAG